MNKSKYNVVLAGLIYDRNLGDQAIFETTEYEVKKIFKENNSEVSIRTIDLCGRTSVKKRSKIMKVFFKIYNKIVGYEKRCSNKVRKECNKKLDKNTDAIVFCGGGLIKYKQQKMIYKAIEIITDYADKYNIPVMLSGVGVEGYDEKSMDCQRLKKAINKDCVKVITTRDDIETLESQYIYNKTIHTSRVCDCACMLNEVYPIQKKDNDIIGIGMLRSNLFQEYGINFSDRETLDLYKNIYNKIIQSGKKCKIFTNGSLEDQKFAQKLIEHIGEDEKEILCKRPEKVSDLVDIITEFKAVVVARLHASIIAYAYEIPSVGLVWNNKQKFFGKAIGYPDRFVERENFNAKVIVDKIKTSIGENYKKIDDIQYKKSNYVEIDSFVKKYILN